jgi:hypothetical protein
MSASFLTTSLGYLAQSRQAAPTTLLALATELCTSALYNLPSGVVFEPLRTPIRNIHSVEELFTIPEEDRFYTCLISGCAQKIANIKIDKCIF